MKKRKIIFSLFLIIGFSLLVVNNNVFAQGSILSVNNEVEIDKDISMSLDLTLIDYDVFKLYISSNQSLDTLSSNDVDFKTEADSLFFEYNINASSLKKLTLNYKLPSTINVGDKITFYMELKKKDNEEEITEIRKTILVIDRKEKEEEKEKEEKTPENKQNNKTPSFNRQVGSFKMNSSFTSTKKVTYPGSDNNYLKSLSVSNYSFNRKFSKDGLTYFVTVKNSVKSLNIKAKADSSKSTVNISGNKDLKVGMNKVLVTVTSQSGRIRNYRIYVTREEK